jgi:hypothetical protein
MTNNQTITIFIVLTIYLIGLGFFLSAMSDDIAIKYSSEEKGVPSKYSGASGTCDCGTLTCTEYALIHGNDAMNSLCSSQEQVNNSVFGNMVVSIESLPLWANTLLIIIPALLWILCGVLLILHG